MSEATEHGTPFLGAFLLRLGIAILVAAGFIAAILAWNQSTASTADVQDSADGRSSETRLALASSEDLEGARLTDVRVLQSAKATASMPEPRAPETSTAPAALDLDPPKLAATQEGSDMALSPVEAENEDLGSAIASGESEESAEESDGFRLPVGISISVGGFSGGRVTIGGGAGGISIGGGGLGSFGRRGVGIITGGGSGCQGSGGLPVPISGPIADGTGPLSEGPVPGDPNLPRALPTLPSVPNTLGMPVEPTTFGPGSDRELRREAGAEGRFLPTDLGRQARNLVTEAISGFSGTARSPESRAASTRQAQPSMRQRVEQALRPQTRQAQGTSARPQARQVQPASRNVQRARRAQPASRPRVTPAQPASRPAAARVQSRSRPAARPAVQRARSAAASRTSSAPRSPSQARGLASRRSEN